jgi:murein DD-endopeptidase MepM/ murein hydrolase activator NlpD
MSWIARRNVTAQLGLAFALALLAGGATMVGAGVIRRGQAMRAEVPNEALLLAVVRAPSAEPAREALAAIPGLRVGEGRSVDEMLGAVGAVAAGGPERLRVFDLGVVWPVAPEELGYVLEAVRAVPGVVDVVDRNREPREALTPNRAFRLEGVGAALAALGVLAFAFGVARIARLSAEGAGEEIALRHLLGAEATRLWAPLGAALGAASVLGALAAVLAARLVVRALQATPVLAAAEAPLDSLAAMVLAALALLVGAAGIACVAARRAVGRIARRALIVFVAALVVATARGARAGGAPADWLALRGVARELAISRRALQRAERARAAADQTALRALAAPDAAVLRVALAEREVDAAQVLEWRAACAALVLRRAELRESYRDNHASGPPIEPRVLPVAGRVMVGFGQSDPVLEMHSFRNGVALGTRPAEVIRATAPGRVAYAADLAGAGPIVVLSHGRRVYSVYGRLGEVLVVRGMEVAAGEPIARAAETPSAFYFGVREKGKAVDPVRWLRSAPPAPPPPRKKNAPSLR